MTVKKINHIGIAVDSLEEAIPIYRDIMGLKLLGTEEVASQKVKVAFFQAGESKIELLESTHPEGPIGKHVERKGPGVHHLAFEVDDIAKALKEAEAAGARLLNKEPIAGAHGTQVAFIHPADTGKVLVELCKSGDEH
jgi:methylmalonyl-CoA/ethylmalonyl-CoA epimerase